MSKFHQYVDRQGNVYKRYIKTQIGVLSGRRPNPADMSIAIPFILSTPEENVAFRTLDNEYFEVEGHTAHVNYDEEVLETYSAEEDRIFRAMNKKAFQEGLLVEYQEESPSINFVNALTDVEIAELARNKSYQGFKKKIQNITSTIALERIKKELIRLDRPNSFVRMVEDRIHVISTNG